MTASHRSVLEVRPEVTAALAAGRAVVALETAVLAHGLPRPRNLEAARRVEAAVREEGAIPASVGVVEGRVVVGMGEEELRRLAAADGVWKASVRDLGPLVAAGRLGATTVAATACAAARAGIRTVATGGIGGVHRGGEGTLDISADLVELARRPVAVVCSGAKAVLDLPRTLEVLETLGVPVVGYGTDELPAFYARESGLRLEHRVETPEEAAAVVRARWSLGLTGGVAFAVPPPEDAALPRAEVEAWVARASEEAAARGVSGKRLTPFLLDRLARLSEGRTLTANLALLERNARVAARIALALAATVTGPPER